MTSPDAPPTSRRALRAQAERERRAAHAPDVDNDADLDRDTDAGTAAAPAPAVSAVAARDAAAPAPAVSAVAARDAAAPASAASAIAEPPTASGRLALSWIDAEALAVRRAPDDLRAAERPFVPVLPDLVAPRRRRRSAAPLLVSIAVILALFGGYTVATQAWSLDAVAPVVTPVDVPAVTSPTSSVAWPAEGVAAVGVGEGDGVNASSDERVAMASVTKLVSMLMVLEERPLAVGEQGEERTISAADRSDYWAFISRGESALGVPAGGTLTQYQIMQGALMASAGNYVRMLTNDLWPTDAEFTDAARTWLDRAGLDGITVVEPTGISRDNLSDPASLIRLGRIAMAHPVIAEIVGTAEVELPGVGRVDNTNVLLADDEVVGIKTGGLIGHYNLLAAKDIDADGTTVRVYAVAMGQPTDARRMAETATLLDEVAAEAVVRQTLAAGTTAGTVTTAWGTSADVVTTTDASVLLWNGGSARSEPALELGTARSAGDEVGSLTVAGPLDAATTPLTLTGDLGEPDAWWRFTHPLELFGLAG